MKKIKFKDIGSTLTGFAFNSQKFNEEKGTPLIRIRDLKQGYTKTFFDGEFDKSFLIEPGDLLIGMDGEFNLVEWESEPALLNQRVCKLIINETKANKSFIKYALPKKLKEIEDATPFVTVKHLSNKQVLEIEIPLPDLKTQQQIAEVLEQADRARQQRKTASALTDEFLQSSFLSLFGDPVKNEKGWEVKKLDEISIVNPRMDNERNLPDDYSVSFIPMSAVDDIKGQIIDFDTRNISEVKKGYTFFKEDDVLFAKITPCMENGKSAIARGLKNRIGFGSTEFHVIRCGEKIIPEYIHSIIRFSHFREIAEDYMTGSAGQKRVPSEFIKNFKIPLPPLFLQQQFASIVEQTEQLRQKQKQSEQELEQLFQSLLQKYFG